MFGFGFGVKHISNTLPDIVFALFSGLNAAAVGLIALAAYNLSNKVITDRITRLEVFISAAFATCFDAQWLYPVLMAVGGLVTLVWDSSAPLRFKLKAEIDPVTLRLRSRRVRGSKDERKNPMGNDKDVEKGGEGPDSIPNVLASPEIINPAPIPEQVPPPQPESIDVDVKTPMEETVGVAETQAQDNHQLSPYFNLNIRNGLLLYVLHCPSYGVLLKMF